jgi:DNA-binding CsgD family transcriptional regulator
MPKSELIRIDDLRGILTLAGECRELGHDPIAWRHHLIAGLGRLVEADMGASVELRGLASLQHKNTGMTYWGHENWTSAGVLAGIGELLEEDPSLYHRGCLYFRDPKREDGACSTRRDFVEDREWYRSTDYDVIHRTLKMDHFLWCFTAIPGRGGDEIGGLLLYRADARKDFGRRDRMIVRETLAALAPWVGGPLARFTEPSPLGLAPRARQVLSALLEGDGDKQIASRLGLSPHTVNDHLKGIYRHFGVRGRAELMALWIRRGRRSSGASG